MKYEYEISKGIYKILTSLLQRMLINWHVLLLLEKNFEWFVLQCETHIECEH